MTELEITLDFLDEPITAEFYALAGAPGRDGHPGQDGHTPVITATKTGKRTTVYVDGSAVAQIDDGTDGQDGEDGQDGHSPVITASKSSGVTTISVDSVAVATISDGVDGQDGAKGDTGAAGHSPVVTASKSGKVTTVSVDGSPIATINDGEDGQDGQDGSDGQDGFSPSASVSKSGSTATITVTDKNGTTTATVSDGQDGHTPVKGTDYWTAEDKAEIVEDVTEEIDLNDYVKNTDYATDSTVGLVKTSTYYGTRIMPDHSIGTYRALTAGIKAGSDDYRPIVPYVQDASTFYGLAKAAGDTTQSASSNTVGNYTDAAKIAIQKMLGIYDAPWELIREDTFTNETEADHNINADSNGQAFELTDIIMMFETPNQDTYAEKGKYGQIWFYYAPNDYIAVEPGSWTQNANTVAHGFMSIIEQKDNMVFAQFTNVSTPSNREGIYYRYGGNFEGASQTLYYSSSVRIFDRIIIPKVTGKGHYKLYGKRKWQ